MPEQFWGSIRMEISSSFNVSAAQSIRSAGRPQSIVANESPSATAIAPRDQLDLSAEALQMSSVGEASSLENTQETDAIRTEKVAAIRRAIADGTYETPERLSGALDRLLDQLD
jgi:anti-sigma28 factor (negative regulator of flagellin synthesis)